MVDIGYKLVVREAIELAKLPASVKVSSWGENNVTVNRQKAPGTVWKDRNLTIDFEKWPIAILQRQSYGEWDTPQNDAERLMFKKIEINVASPNGMLQLGKAIELLLGV